jgi:hypothetical protein
VLLRNQPQLLEAGDLRLGEGLVGELDERRPAPERERTAQSRFRLGRRAGRERTSTLRQQALEPARIDRLGVDAQHVPRRVRRQDAGVGQRLAQVRHVRLHDLGRGGRRARRPQLRDEALGGYHLVRPQEEQHEQRPLAAAPERERPIVVHDLERPENAEVHGFPGHRTTFRGARGAPLDHSFTALYRGLGSALPTSRRLAARDRSQRGGRRGAQGGTMFKDSKTRWLVTIVAVSAAAVMLVAPAGAWQDVAGGRMDGNGSGSLPPPEVQERQASILTNAVHEGRLAERRVGTTSVVPASTSGTVVATMNPGLVETGGRTFVPGVDSSGASVLLEVGPSLEVGSVASRDDVVADKAAPAPAVEFVPGVTDSTTGVYATYGIEPPAVVAATGSSDDSFNWNSDILIAISVALAMALLMALGTFALVSQRRRRVAL